MLFQVQHPPKICVVLPFQRQLILDCFFADLPLSKTQPRSDRNFLRFFPKFLWPPPFAMVSSQSLGTSKYPGNAFLHPTCLKTLHAASHLFFFFFFNKFHQTIWKKKAMFWLPIKQLWLGTNITGNSRPQGIFLRI